MPLHFLQIALYSIASFLVGGAIAWRVLGRGHGGYSRKLAQELTDSVHQRCSAYRHLEGRIDAAIAEFDRREAGLPGELPQSAPAPETLEVEEIVEVPESELAAVAAGQETLAWMDDCGAPGDPIAPVAAEASFVGLPLPDPPFVEETGNVVDQFAQRLEILQREKTDELAQQRGRVERIEGRMQSIESSLEEILRLVRAGPQASSASAVEGPPGWQRDLQELLERFLRSEGAIAAWHAQHEAWSSERLALVESTRAFAARMGEATMRNPEAEAAAAALRERAEELARDAAKLQSSISKREVPAPRPASPAARSGPEPVPSSGAARPVRAEPVEIAPPPAEVAAEAPAQEAESAPESTPASATEVTPDVATEASSPEVTLDEVQSILATASAAAQGTGEGTQVGQLMKNLEIAKADADKYRRKLHEQGLQFSAAYAMLDRIRPFVQALESEFAAQARGGEKKS